jgi:hypothetical protein
MNYRKVCVLLLAGLVGCASSGVIPTGPDTYMLTKKGAGGMFTNGNEVLGDLYREASDFGEHRGQVVKTVGTDAQNAIPFARMPNAKLDFRCIDKPSQAASAAG